ncbi:hypothetical protein, partial [Vibrio anguillarum]|uniref:hypothetical protein n=1 Tax=Vibrio anguillarum TaxID=55601 RepID=UPI001F18F594
YLMIGNGSSALNTGSCKLLLTLRRVKKAIFWLWFRFSTISLPVLACYPSFPEVRALYEHKSIKKK